MSRIGENKGIVPLSGGLKVIVYGDTAYLDDDAYLIQVQRDGTEPVEIVYQWTGRELDDLLAGKFTGPHPLALREVLELWAEWRGEHPADTGEEQAALSKPWWEFRVELLDGRVIERCVAEGDTPTEAMHAMLGHIVRGEGAVAQLCAGVGVRSLCYVRPDPLTNPHAAPEGMKHGNL